MVEESKDFVRQMIDADLKSQKHGGRVHTRFPPEPNGYLHVGHAKAICLNFGIKHDFQSIGAICNLRFDDTNPAKESVEFVESIQSDVSWLGFDWGEKPFFASDYFSQIYLCAEQLIEKDLAFVCSLSADQVRETRGTLTEAGTPSPDRNRSIAENLALFRKMKAGEFDDGAYTLRAKIDMSAPNMIMRDPTLYRIRRVHHHRTGDEWCIYPMYDFTHCISDALENITHSLCTLEFENNRPLYDWVLDHLDLKDIRSDEQPQVKGRPYQTESARLGLEYTVMSKRKLLTLVDDEHVEGWDDPRMPTLSGMRRRGYTPAAIKAFCREIGVTKNNTLIELARLEHSLRKDLEEVAPRRMGVIDPIKVVITNYPEGQSESVTMKNHPSDESMGTREVTFSRELYIERSDFEKIPPPKYRRLSPGKEVRLRRMYLIRCDEVIENNEGHVTELRCTYDDQSKGGKSSDGRKVKGIIHWVNAEDAIQAEVRLYDKLFKDPVPDLSKPLESLLNENSLRVVQAQVEPAVASTPVGTTMQFMRQGYFVKDRDSKEGALVLNQTISLKDSWAKMNKKKK